MSDRAAYISFLEAQVERAGAISLEAEEVGIGLQRLRSRVEQLEEKVHANAHAVELTQAHAGDSAHAARREVEDQLRTMEARVRHLEHGVGDAKLTTEADLSRLRNEFALAIEELRQRVDERLLSLQAWRSEVDEGASGIIREAQATCVRLADDALAAAEASQRKVEELTRRTQAGLEVLRVDVTSLRAELAGLSQRRSFGQTERWALPGPAETQPLEAPALHTGSTQVTTAAVQAARGVTISEDVAGVLGDTIERRLAARLGQQVLQLSEVLRRVVQAQAALQQQWGAANHPRSTHEARINEVRFGGQAVQHRPPADGARRAGILDELYRELRHLEECDAAVRGAVSAASRPQRTSRSRGLQSPV